MSSRVCDCLTEEVHNASHTPVLPPYRQGEDQARGARPGFRGLEQPELQAGDG